MSPQRGRPKSADSKHERLYVRVEATEKQKIMDFCQEYKKTILELIRAGMDAIKK